MDISVGNLAYTALAHKVRQRFAPSGVAQFLRLCSWLKLVYMYTYLPSMRPSYFQEIRSRTVEVITIQGILRRDCLTLQLVELTVFSLLPWGPSGARSTNHT
jgi:hypothetical protein